MTLPVNKTWTGTCNNALWPEINLDVLVKAFNECFGPPIIEVWVGDPTISIMPLSEYPNIIKSDLIDSDMLYIMAGVGVVAGKNVDELLWEEGFWG